MAPGRHPTVNRNPSVNRSTNQNNVDINSGIDTQMLNQLIATRFKLEASQLAAVTLAASTHRRNQPMFGFSKSSLGRPDIANYKVFRAVMHEKLSMYCLGMKSSNGICGVVDLKVKGTNLTALQSTFLITQHHLCLNGTHADRLLERYIEGLPLNIKGNVTLSKPVDLHEAIEMAQGLMYQVVQENKANVAELHLVPETQSGILEAKEDREAMSLVLDVNQGKPLSGNNKLHPIIKEEAGHPAEYTSYVPKAAVVKD
ncbi:hypothetical protein Tco_1005083 [Tanacetum coccineum]|uniref:Uncharacterized protein n=1 Tax=Tanacetum coccineum TaxID=301880 RepID=A0ABQ5FE19_9ASTR